MVTVAVVQPHRLFREALTLSLGVRERISVLVAAATADELVVPADGLAPDVVVLDLGLPGRQGLDEARRLAARFPSSRVLMIGCSHLELDVLASIEAGAAGYLLDEASHGDLVRSIHAVATGRALCSPRVASLLFTRVAEVASEATRRSVQSLVHLTPREVEILELIEAGQSNKEIGARLGIELQTVKNHVHNILERMQVRTRGEAAARFRRHTGPTARRIHQPGMSTSQRTL